MSLDFWFNSAQHTSVTSRCAAFLGASCCISWLTFLCLKGQQEAVGRQQEAVGRQQESMGRQQGAPKEAAGGSGEATPTGKWVICGPSTYVQIRHTCLGLSIPLFVKLNQEIIEYLIELLIRVSLHLSAAWYRFVAVQSQFPAVWSWFVLAWSWFAAVRSWFVAVRKNVKVAKVMALDYKKEMNIGSFKYVTKIIFTKNHDECIVEQSSRWELMKLKK